MKNRYILDPTGKIVRAPEENAEQDLVKADIINNKIEKNILYKDLDHFVDKESNYNDTYLGNYINPFSESFSTSVEIDNLDLSNFLIGNNKENFKNAVRLIITDNKPAFGFLDEAGDNQTVNQGAFRQFNSFLDTEITPNAEGSDVIPFVDEFEFYTGYRDTVVEESALIPSIALVFEYLIDVIIEASLVEGVVVLNKLDQDNNKTGNFLDGYSKEFKENKLVLGEYIITEVDVFSRYFLEVLNYPFEEGNLKADYFLKRLACYFIGLNEWISQDRIYDWDVLLDAIFKANQSVSSIFIGEGAATSISAILVKTIDITLSSLTNSASLKRIMLLIKKFNTQKFWVQNQLYSAKRKSPATSYIVDSLNYYYFKFFIERVNVGIKIWNRKFDLNSINNLINDDPYFTNRISQDFSKNIKTKTIDYNISADATEAKNILFNLLNGTLTPAQKSQEINKLRSALNRAKSYTADYEFKYNFNDLSLSNIPTALMFNRSIVNLNPNNIGKTSNVYNNKIFAKTDERKLPIELVNKIEDSLESEYMPFYFHDIRTNELISFHAFIENLSDSYTPDYVATSGFGRIDDVRSYVKTSRNISLSFIVAAMNKEDHDNMWYYINKLVTMVYPQWSKGEELAYGDKIIQQPFSQVPTNSPLIRLRIGDLIKNNYSRFNLSRIFGIEDMTSPDFVKKVTTSEIDWEKTTKNRVSKREKFLKARLEKDNIDYHTIRPELIKLTDLIKRSNLKDKLKDEYFVFSFTVVKKDYKELSYIPTPVDDKLVKNFDYIQFEKLTSLQLSEYRKAVKARLTSSNNGQLSEAQRDVLEVERFADSFFGKYKRENAIIGKRNIKYKVDISKDLDKFNKEKEGIMKPFNADGSINNPITKAYESGMSKGLAGHITQLDLNYADAVWEIDHGSKAPMMVKVTMSFAPIHDIPLGLDYKGMPRAVNYNVGGLNKEMFGDPLQKYEDEE